MAWSSVQIAAADQAAYLASKPYLAASNVLRRRLRAPVWSTSGAWSTSDTGDPDNADNASLPTRYLTNDQLYDYSSPSSAVNGLAAVYLLLDLVAGSDVDQVFDTLFLEVLNGTAFTNLAALLELADDEDFATRFLRPISMTGWGGKTAKMIGGWLASSEGASPRRFQDVRYARIKFTTTDGGGFTTVGGKVPQLSEVWLSRRWQLAHNPREPFDDEPRSSYAQDFTSPYGGLGRDVRYKGRQNLPLRFRPTTSTASLAGIDELTAIRSWFRDADDGVRPFLYVDDPVGGPGGNGKGHFMYLPEPELLAASMGSLQVREFEAHALELPPFQSREVF